MIGPHQGKELELMLAGKKHLAVFSDAIPADGEIPEEIIPEQAFASYVKSGTLFRLQHNSVLPDKSETKNLNIRTVCFTSKGNEWRAHAFLWLQNECLAKRRPFDEAYEFFVGRLLDYEESDIHDFIKNVRYCLK